jgi:ATP-dependent Clp protease ATP-binding subunit ClpA
LDELRIKLVDMLRKTIRPEFLNRIDEVIIFKPLLKNELRKIVDLQLQQLEQMLSEKNISFKIDDEAKDWLAKLGYDVTYGARPLKRTIQKYVVNPLSQELLMNKFQSGDTVHVEVGEDGKFHFK